MFQHNILQPPKNICQKQKHIENYRGRKGHGILGDCQILRHSCIRYAFWGVMGINAASLVVKNGVERDTYSTLRQVDFIKWTPEMHLKF